MPIQSVNPTTGALLRSYEPLTEQQLETRVQRAWEARLRWADRPVAQRAAIVGRAGALMEARKAALGRLMTLEMGKPLRAAIEEASKCAAACRYFAENAARFLADEVVAVAGEAGCVAFQPLGVILAVMPWNFPFWQVIRFAAPALAAGNTGLLKHASNVPQCALALEQLFLDAGAPDGVFQTLLIGSERVAALLADDRVAAATLTGSEPAGRSLAVAAANNIKKTVLELGGSDAFIVLPSAQLDGAVATAVRARLINNAESCIAAKRFIVHESIAAEFERRFVDGMRAVVIGDPMDERTDLGPLATARIRDDLHRQVRESVERGARLLLGGMSRPGPGFFYEPTVLTDIPRDAPAYREELFGPVAAMFTVRDVDEAIDVANDTRFGLGAAAWTRDQAEARRLARQLHAGTVFINGLVALDPRFPFGGIRASGYGRELSSFGIREFVNIKTIRMVLPPGES